MKQPKVYSKVCPECGRLIEAWSESQLEWNMKLHRMSKHTTEE